MQKKDNDIIQKSEECLHHLHQGKEALTEPLQKLEEINAQLLVSYRDLIDSLNYAKHIQQNFMPPKHHIANFFDDFFILLRPRNIVSGDFYYFRSTDDDCDLAVFGIVDCTGHGIPGAMLSMVGYSFIDQAVHQRKHNAPGEILTFLDNRINRFFRQNENMDARDGMEPALCSYHRKSMILKFGSSRRSLYHINNGLLTVYDGEKLDVGGNPKQFSDSTLPVQKGDLIYLFSDGFQDQLGGEKDKKFSKKRFQELLLSICKNNMTEQKKILDKTLIEWIGSNEQTDDVLVFGVKI